MYVIRKFEVITTNNYTNSTNPAINDIIIAFEVIRTQSLVYTGLIVFVFLVSILQGRRTIMMQMRNKHLSENLRVLNADLEKKVSLRTDELNDSLEELKNLNLLENTSFIFIQYDVQSHMGFEGFGHLCIKF